MVALVVLGLVLLVGIAASLGLTPDTRDSEFDCGRLLRSRRSASPRPSGR